MAVEKPGIKNFSCNPKAKLVFFANWCICNNSRGDDFYNKVAVVFP